jgi:hypothetical protein
MALAKEWRGNRRDWTIFGKDKKQANQKANEDKTIAVHRVEFLNLSVLEPYAAKWMISVTV